MKKHSFLKIFLIVFAVILVMICGLIAFGSYVLNSYYDNQIGVVEVNQEMRANMEESYSVELNDVDLTLIDGGKATSSIYKVQQKDSNIINVLLVGMDARGKETVSRSDTIILASYNKETHSVKLTSFLRDTWVYLPEYGWGKINSATAYGGVGLLVNTLNENFDLDIQHYVQVRFNDFSDIIDTIGGIDVELTKSEINYINNKLHTEDRDWKNDIKAEPGLVHLNGVQALWHCRNRSIGNGDFERTDRQREVLQIMMNKALTMNLTQITQLVYEMKDHVDMNVPINTIISLAKDVLGTNSVTMESYRIPFENDFKFANKYGASVIEIDIDKATDKLHEIIGFEVEERITINGEEVKISDIYSIEEKESKYVEANDGVEVHKEKESGGLTVSTR